MPQNHQTYLFRFLQVRSAQLHPTQIAKSRNELSSKEFEIPIIARLNNEAASKLNGKQRDSLRRRYALSRIALSSKQIEMVQFIEQKYIELISQSDLSLVETKSEILALKEALESMELAKEKTEMLIIASWNNLTANILSFTPNLSEIETYTNCIRVLDLVINLDNYIELGYNKTLNYYLTGILLLPDRILTLLDGIFIRPGTSLDNPISSIKPLGVADLKLTREKLTGYELGEITHIENILKSENRQRTHRRFNRTEEFYQTEEQSEKEEERNLENKEKFDLQKEANKTIQENFNVNAGVNISGSYGPVQITANAGFAYVRSLSESQKESSNFSKEIVDQARKKIIQKVTEIRSKKLIDEIEEINIHGFENTGAGAVDISGIYRWLNKTIECQVFNYGKRLMLEFIIQEPAAYFLYAKKMNEVKEFEVAKPLELPDSFKPSSIANLSEPLFEGLSVEDLIKRYSVEGIEPKPAETVTISTTCDSQEESEPSGIHNLIQKDLQIIEGYAASTLDIHFNLNASDAAYQSVAWSVGKSADTEYINGLPSEITEKEGTLTKKYALTNESDHRNLDFTYQFLRKNVRMQGETGLINISAITMGAANLNMGVTITATITSQKTEAWQLSVFNKIIQKYNLQVAEYHEKKNRAEAAQASKVQNFSLSNPDFYKELIKDEIKKNCIRMLTGWDFTAFDAMRENGSLEPELNINDSLKEGKAIDYFENAIEWDKIAYTFYSYFWGKKQYWSEKILFEHGDQHFQYFIKAGAAKVLVPVSPLMTASVLWYFKTGQALKNSDLPAIEYDTETLNMLQDIADSAVGIDQAVEEGKPWQITLPTSLIILNSQAAQIDEINNQLMSE